MSTNEISTQSAAETFTPGQTIAESFTLKQKLSSSDTGTRWLAHDGDSGRDVELLFLPAALLGDDDVLGELRAQVKLNRQLIHPHVLRTHDFIEEKDWAAISSDAADAESLASLMAKKEGKCFDPSEIKGWLATICQTLDDAHRANLLHRDLGPQNILLSNSTGVLIANFGVTRIILDALGRAKPGSIDEHLAAMSPQQLDGELPARWDDIYSLGVLIYQLLTGKPPFYTGDLLPQIRKTVPPAVSARRAELGIPGEQVPAGWEKIIAACLEKHTPGRPKSAREVALKLAADSPSGAAVQAPPAAAAAVQTAPVPADVKQGETPAETKPEKQPAPPTGDKPAGSKESLIEEIVWRKPPPQAAPGAPASFKHLLERVPDEQDGRKTSPVAKLVPIAGVCLVILAAVLLWPRGKKQEQTQTAVPSPAAPVATAVPVAPPVTNATPAAATPVPVATPVVVTSQAGKPTPQVATTEPARTPAILPASMPPEKMRALEQARKAVDDTQKSLQDQTQLQQQADTAATAAKSDVDAKASAMTALKKTTDDIAAQRKQSEDAAAKAAADAADAQKAATEKLRISDDAKKALDLLVTQAKQQDDAQQKAAAELQALQTAADEKQRAAADAAKAKNDLQAKLEQQQQALKQAQEESMQPAPAASPAAANTLPLPSGTSEALVPIDGDKSPASIEASEQVVLQQISQKQQNPAAATPQPAPPSTYVPNPKSQIDKTLTNSLGMKFQPVGDVLFCIWLVRVQDFDAFAKATHFKGTSWMEPGFKQGPDHPVVNVTWNDAVAFCKWLTEKEQRAGLLAPNQIYRLPTDLEWSKAVGLPEETGKTPEVRDMDVPDVYPWGTQWPPPQGAGNYTGEETSSDVAIKGYDDGYGFTSPVGSFTVNKYGLYDMGGNAWEWCMDWWNGEQKARVLRGASWYNGGLKLSLLSSCRAYSAPDNTTDNFGFRVVIATEGRPKK